MRDIIPHLLPLLVALTVGTAQASGQRSATITDAAIAGYPVIDVHAESPPGPVLHYVGSTTDWHLLMITRTAVSRDAQGRLGMPWDTVFAYKVAADALAIDNGWSLEEPLQDGITVTPRDCPRLHLQPGQRRHVLPPDERLKARCLGLPGGRSPLLD